MATIARPEPKHDASSAENSSDNLTRVARQTTERMADTARESIEFAKAAGASIDEQRETALRATENTAEFGRMFVDLLGEQMRHNMQAAAAFGRAANWLEIAQVQQDLIGGSFKRFNQINDGYREIIRTGMVSLPFTARH